MSSRSPALSGEPVRRLRNGGSKWSPGARVPSCTPPSDARSLGRPNSGKLDNLDALTRLRRRARDLSPPASPLMRRPSRIALLRGRRPGRRPRPIAPELLGEVRRQPTYFAEFGQDPSQQLDPRRQRIGLLGNAGSLARRFRARLRPAGDPTPCLRSVGFFTPLCDDGGRAIPARRAPIREASATPARAPRPV